MKKQFFAIATAMIIATSTFGAWRETGHSNDSGGRGNTQPTRPTQGYNRPSGGTSYARPTQGPSRPTQQNYCRPTQPTYTRPTENCRPTQSYSRPTQQSYCRPTHSEPRSYGGSSRSVDHYRPSYSRGGYSGSSISFGYSSGYRSGYSLSYSSGGYGIDYQPSYYSSGVSVVSTPPVAYYPSQSYVPASDYYPQTSYEEPATTGYVQQQEVPQQQVFVQQQVPQQQVIVEREAPQQQVFVQQEAPQQGQVSQEIPTNPSEGYVQQQNGGPTITIKPVQNVEVTPNAVYHLRLSSGKVVSFSIDVGQ